MRRSVIDTEANFSLIVTVDGISQLFSYFTQLMKDVL